MAFSQCIQKQTCGLNCPRAPLPGSSWYTARRAWNGSCSCPSASVSYANLIDANNSCLNTLVSYAYMPESQAQRDTCRAAQYLQADQSATVAMLVLYFGVPLALLCVVFLRKCGWGKKAARLPVAASSSERHAAHLSFQNVRYVVPIKGGTKEILKGITAEFTPGSLTAVMGPSGCGKSSLLDILAQRGRGQGAGVSARILVNGVKRGNGYKRISAYVEQFDALFPHLTVREMLMFSAELRLDADAEERLRAVERVITDLELTRCADSLIGDPAGVRGISGGQSRRVTVGVELLGKPSLLFLDEPTTGLDSASAMQLVKTLKGIAQAGCTVAATIHQPRSATFAMFDCLLLMKAGHVVYSGALSAVPAYLAKVGVQVPPKVNLADFLVDMMYDDAAGDMPAALDTAVVDRLQDAWATSVEARQLHGRVVAPANMPPPFKEYNESTGENFARPVWMQVDILLRRGYVNMARNRGFFVALAMQNAQFIFYALLFLGLRTQSIPIGLAGYDPQMQYIRNFLYQVMNTVCILEAVIIASAFVEKRIFLREHAAGAYSLYAYHSAWFIRLQVDAIYKGLLAAVLCYFAPPMIISAPAFFFFAVTLMVVSTVGSSLGFFMAMAFSDAEGASNVHNSIIGFVGVYCGFYLPSRLIPIFTLWAYYVSFLTYAFEALELNQFGPCASYSVKAFELSLNLNMNKWTNLLVVMAWGIGFHLLAIGVSMARLRTRKIGDMQPGGPSDSSDGVVEMTPPVLNAAPSAAKPVASDALAQV